MSSGDSYDDANGAMYTSFGDSTEVFVADDEAEDGVSRKARSESLMSIVSVHFEDVADYDGDSDKEAFAIEDSSPATKDDAVVNLNLNSRTLTPLRSYLRVTFQWIPRRVSTLQKAFCILMQALILAFLCCCYALDVGAFDKILWIEEKRGETVTIAKNIIWSFRLLEMNILGVLYFRKRHLEKMLSEVRLTRRYWKKVRRTIYKIFLAVFLFVFVFPICLRVAQMTMKTEKAASFKIKQIAYLNVALSLLARLFTLPIFFAFVYVVYITFCHIRLYKEQIQKWPEHSKEQARNRFLDIKSIIRDTERSFQAFLLVHLLLLLVLLVPAVFSCAERLHSESQYQETYTDKFKLASSEAKAKTLEDPLNVANLTNDHMQTVRIVLQLPKDVGRSTVNKTRPDFVPRTRTHLDTSALVKVICSALGEFLEMTVLFSLPIIFLAKVDKIMKSLPEVVENLKFTEQKRHGYLFQDRQVLDEMLQDLSTGRGVQIMRMNLTGVKAAVLTLLMPFLTTIFKLLFVHVDIT